MLRLLLAFAASGPALAQERPPSAAPPASSSQSQRLTFEYQDAELTEIVRAVSQFTNTNYAFDDRLRGRVTITAPRSVDRQEAHQLLTSALRMAGFVVVRAPGAVYEIVPLGESAGRVEYSASTPRAFVDAPITTLVPLRAAQADALLQVVQPLLGANAVVQAFEPTNALILSASEAQVRRALIVIRALDRAEERRLAVLRPRYRDTEDLLQLLQQTFPESRRASESLRIFGDARTNALLVEGPPDLVKEVREFLNSVDVPTPGQGAIHVLRLHHADAEELAKVIEEVASGAGARSGAVNSLPGLQQAGEELTGRDFALSADKATNSIVIRSDAETLRLLGRLIADLDVDVPSVSVKVMLLEVENADSLDLAVDGLFPLSTPATPSDVVSFVRTLNGADPSLLSVRPIDPATGLLFRYASDPVTFNTIGPDGQPLEQTIPSYAVDVKALATAANTKLLSQPHIVARSGEEQELFVGNNIPIVSATQSSAAGDTANVAAADPLQISQNIERQDVGVRLRVEPTVTEEGPVRLELRVEFSALTAPLAGDPATVGPTLIEQSVESTIYLDDGSGAIVGVRGEPTQDSVRTGTPWLMNVPALGWIFGSTSTRTTRKDLVLSVQVEVIRSPEDLELESIRRRVALERSVVGLDRLPVNPDEAPYAVWVFGSERQDEAEAVAANLTLDSREARVVPWKSGSPQHYDVFVLGFAHFGDAMRTSLAVRDQGYEPEVVALPGLD